jgi:hypothetical protein
VSAGSLTRLGRRRNVNESNPRRFPSLIVILVLKPTTIPTPIRPTVPALVADTSVDIIIGVAGRL